MHDTEHDPTPGERVRYVGDITNRDCDATVETHADAGDKIPLRIDNGALFLADPADIRRQIARMNQDAADSARRLGLDPDDISHASFPKHCMRCGRPMFTGSSVAICGMCHEDLGDDVGRFVRAHSTDRVAYISERCPKCGTPAVAHRFCGRCGKSFA